MTGEGAGDWSKVEALAVAARTLLGAGLAEQARPVLDELVALARAVRGPRADVVRLVPRPNLFGAATLTKAILPAMRAQRSGRIINITSMGGKIHSPLGSWYRASKHALEGWSDSLRIETAHFGIDVVIVEPGAIATEFGSVLEEPMIARSANGAYGAMTKSVAEATRSTYDKDGASPSSVVADTISKAISARRPRTRYVVGKYARPLLFLRRWLSDRLFDSIIMSQVKRVA